MLFYVRNKEKKKMHIHLLKYEESKGGGIRHERLRLVTHRTWMARVRLEQENGGDGERMEGERLSGACILVQF